MKGLKVLDALANKMASEPRKPKELMKEKGSEAAESPMEHMSDAHEMSEGENFGINELEGRICHECHSKLKALGPNKGKVRPEHA